MAGHNDQNPFSHDDDINPFAKNHNNHRVPPSSRLSALDPEPALVYGHGVAPPTSLDTPAKLKKKRQELQAKEAELNKREEILRRKEEAIAKWVPISLFWNLIMSIAVFASGAEGAFVFFSAIYFLLGPPGAFYFWYRPLYRGFRTDNGTSFGCFFFNYLNHIVFFTFAAIGPRILFSGLHFAGILNAIDLIGRRPALGIMSFIGFGFFAVELVLSIWVMQQVYKHFRGTGKSTNVSIHL